MKILRLGTEIEVLVIFLHDSKFANFSNTLKFAKMGFLTLTNGYKLNHARLIMSRIVTPSVKLFFKSGPSEATEKWGVKNQNLTKICL